MISVPVPVQTQRVLIGILCLVLGMFTYTFASAGMEFPPWAAGLATGLVVLHFLFLMEGANPRTPVLPLRCADYLSRTFLKSFAAPFAMAVVYVLFAQSSGGAGAIGGLIALCAGAAVLWLTFPGSLAGTVGKMVRGRPKPVISSETKAAEVALPRGDPGITWGGLRIPSKAATSHFMVVGTTGSGKTVTLRLLMQDVLPSIGTGADHRALIYDAKQDIVSQISDMGLSCKVHTLNPFDTRCVAWDMCRDIIEPSAALQTAVTLIPEEAGSNQPFFVNAAQTLLYGVLVAFIVRQSDWYFSDLIRAMKDPKRLELILRGTQETRHIPEMLFGDTQTLSNIQATIATKVLPYEPIAALWDQAKERVSLEEWVKHRETNNYILILGNSEKARAALDAINQVLFKRLSELVLDQDEDREDKRRTWIFLDEIAEAGKLDGLSSLLSKGRSKGTCVVLGFQDIDGMRVVYGEHQAQALTSQCNNKAILRLESPATTEWAAKFFGTYEAIEIKKSETKAQWKLSADQMGHNTTTYAEEYVKREAVLESEFAILPVTNQKNGLSGFYIVPSIGAYRHTYSGEWLFNPERRALARPAEGVRDFVRTEPAQQFLRPWTDEDFQRLRFPELGTVLEDAPPEATSQMAAHAPRSSRRP